MASADFADAAEADKACFYKYWDKNRIKSVTRKKNHIAMVADYNGLVVGYMLYQINDDHMELIRMAVHPNFRNKGAGSAMIVKLKQRLKPDHRTRIVVILSQWIDQAHIWLRNRGFLATEVLHGEDDDFYQFEYWLDQDEVYQSLQKLERLSV